MYQNPRLFSIRIYELHTAPPDKDIDITSIIMVCKELSLIVWETARPWSNDKVCIVLLEVEIAFSEFDMMNCTHHSLADK